MSEYPGDLQEEMEISEGFFSLFGPWSEHIEELEQVIDGPVSLVRARTMNGSIVVRSGDQAGVTIRAWKIVRGPMEGLAEAFAERVKVHTERHGETVQLFALYPGLPLGCCVFVRYEIGVPREADLDLYTHNGGINVIGVEGAVEAETWSGNIDLQDTMGPAKLYASSGSIRIMGLDGAVEAASGSGAISVEGSSGHANLRTTNGDIKILSSDAIVRARSYAGDIEVQGECAGVDLQTVTGDVRASFSDGCGRVKPVNIVAISQKGSLFLEVAARSAIIDAEAVEGSIDLGLSSEFAGSLEAGTQRGAMTCDLAMVMDLKTSKLLTGHLGEGGAGRVKVQTFGGDIHIRAHDGADAPPGL
jgi:hypothetical protein